MGILGNMMQSPLTHLGMGLLDSSAGQYSLNPGDIQDRGIMGGLLSGMGSYQNQQRMNLDDDAQRMRMQTMQHGMGLDNRRIGLEEQQFSADQASAQQQQQALQAFVASLPPEERQRFIQLYQLDPDRAIAMATAQPASSRNPNKAFHPDGSPNTQYQKYTLDKAAKGGEVFKVVGPHLCPRHVDVKLLLQHGDEGDDVEGVEEAIGDKVLGAAIFIFRMKVPEHSQ
jgi:hypothetical protein